MLHQHIKNVLLLLSKKVSLSKALILCLRGLTLAMDSHLVMTLEATSFF
jgi:hypothetical protein